MIRNARKRLDLYAAVRSVRNLDGVSTRFQDVEMIIVPREHRGAVLVDKRRHFPFQAGVALPIASR